MFTALIRVVVAAAAATTATAAHAQAVYTQAVQTTRGSVTLWSGTPKPVTIGYNLAAPDPAASWSPPRQTLLLGPNQPQVPHAYLDMTWASTVTPSRIALEVLTTQNQYAVSTTSYVTYNHVLELHFSLAQETPATFEAFLVRQIANYNEPIRIVLSQVGQSPLVSINFERPPYGSPVAFIYPLTPFTLPAGDYVLRYTEGSSSGFHYSTTGIAGASDTARFALNFIPAPGALPALLAAAALAARRRR